MKIAINRQHGGFGLSEAAFESWLKRKNIEFYKWPGQYGTVNYTTVTEDEFRKIQDAEMQAPPVPGRFDKSNACWLSDSNIARNDPDLIAVIQELDKDANGTYADIGIVEIPDGVDWQIEEYDGSEWVAEVHRTWS
jgi:hypothetical protein